MTLFTYEFSVGIHSSLYVDTLSGTYRCYSYHHEDL